MSRGRLALSQALGDLSRQYNLPVQSHLSESPGEVAWVRELHPGTSQTQADTTDPLIVYLPLPSATFVPVVHELRWSYNRLLASSHQSLRLTLHCDLVVQSARATRTFTAPTVCCTSAPTSPTAATAAPTSSSCSSYTTLGTSHALSSRHADVSWLAAREDAHAVSPVRLCLPL